MPGLALCLALCLGLGLAGCGQTVTIRSHDLDAADRAACRALLDDLPDSLAGEDPVEVEPDDALGAAYGDPALVVTCGVPVPEGFDRTSSCDEADGVGWFIPDSQRDHRDRDLVATAVGWSPRVEVRVPEHYRSGSLREGDDTVAAALAQLAAPIRAHLTLTDACD